MSVIGLTVVEKFRTDINDAKVVEEFKNLKTNIEYANFNFGRRELEENNLANFTGEQKKYENVVEMQKVSDQNKNDAFDYLAKTKYSISANLYH